MSDGREVPFLTDRPLLTLRVSRDDGATREATRTVRSTENLAPMVTSEWPPCECWRCKGR